METATADRQKHTYEDYLRTPEGASWQLVEGQLVEEAAAPGIAHQDIAGRLYRALCNYVELDNLGKVLIAPVDVYLDKHNCLQPDILFISTKRAAIIEEMRINGAPDLVVEILSPSSVKRDLMQKKKLYEKFGVREYWIVHPMEQIIEAYTLIQGSYDLVNVFTVSDTLESTALKSLKLPLVDLFTISSRTPDL